MDKEPAALENSKLLKILKITLLVSIRARIQTQPDSPTLNVSPPHQRYNEKFAIYLGNQVSYKT